MSDYIIKKKSRLWKILPGGRNKFSATLGATIYLTPKRYDDWKSGTPKKSTLALIEHEKVHVDQYRRDPGFKRKYVTSRRHRMQYEAEAYAKQAHVRIQLGSRRDRHYYISQYATLLSSKTYLLFCSFKDAYVTIENEYNKLNKQK